MGTESPCMLRMGREQYHGTARLESEHIDFAGTTKFRFRFSEMRNPGQSEGFLTFSFHGHAVSLDVGGKSSKWLAVIRHPKTISDKLGIRAGHAIRLINFEDAALSAQIEQKKARIVGKDWTDRCDVIIFAVERPAELRRLATMVDEVQPDGAIWVMLPKASKNVTQANVLTAIREAGLIDSRIVSQTDTHSAYRVALHADKRSTKPNGAPPARALRTTPRRISTTPVARRTPLKK